MYLLHSSYLKKVLAFTVTAHLLQETGLTVKKFLYLKRVKNLNMAENLKAEAVTK